MAEEEAQVSEQEIEDSSGQQETQEVSEQEQISAEQSDATVAEEANDVADNVSGEVDVSGTQAEGLAQEGTDMQGNSEQQVSAEDVAGNVSEASVMPLEDMSGNEGIASQEENEDAIELLKDVELNVKIELGRAKMYVEDVLKLTEGAVVELDKLAGDPVDIYVNERLVARGEVLVLNENFCVRVNQIVRDVV